VSRGTDEAFAALRTRPDAYVYEPLPLIATVIFKFFGAGLIWLMVMFFRTPQEKAGLGDQFAYAVCSIIMVFIGMLGLALFIVPQERESLDWRAKTVTVVDRFFFVFRTVDKRPFSDFSRVALRSKRECGKSGWHTRMTLTLVPKGGDKAVDFFDESKWDSDKIQPDPLPEIARLGQLVADRAALPFAIEKAPETIAPS
jgi:hypothetical protein